MPVWFKNLQLYRLDKEWTLPAGELEEKLAARPLLPCSAMSLESRGWVSPRGDEQLVYGVEKHLMLALGTEQKLLPSSVVNDAVKQRAAEFEKEKGFKPGRKQLRDFKDIVSAELLPRAFSRRNTTRAPLIADLVHQPLAPGRPALKGQRRVKLVRASVDPVAQRIVVDSSSPTRAEQLIEHLRDTLGELSVSLPQTEISPGQRLTEWLTARAAPGHFDLGEECELTGTDAAKSVVRYLRHSLDAEQIRRHLDEGLKASRLALTWNGRLGLVVSDKLQIKRVKFLEMDEVEEGAAGVDPERAFEAEFLLMAGQCGPMLDELLTSFGLPSAA